MRGEHGAFEDVEVYGAVFGEDGDGGEAKVDKDCFVCGRWGKSMRRGGGGRRLGAEHHVGCGEVAVDDLGEMHFCDFSADEVEYEIWIGG
jgi:hypothetical protein